MSMKPFYLGLKVQPGTIAHVVIVLYIITIPGKN